VDPTDRRAAVPNTLTHIPQYQRLCQYTNQSLRVFMISLFCFAFNIYQRTNKVLDRACGTNGLFCIYIPALLQLSAFPVECTDEKPTLRHKRPLCSLIGPSMPKATPLNHQKHNTMEPAHTPNEIALVRCVQRREEKMKWSRRCANMSTAKYRVGSCMEVSQRIKQCSGHIHSGERK
jgi:hypothetical protein